jgi:cardiolipin synthase
MFVALSFLLQLGWLLVQILALNNSPYIAGATHLIAVLAVLKLYSKPTNGAYKLPWIMLMMALPVMGLSLYLLTRLAVSPRSVHRRLQSMKQKNAPFLENAEIPRVLAPEEENLAKYLRKYEGNPAWDETDAKYYGETLDALADMKKDLEAAETFIFMEYFILEDGEAFRQLREILERKAAQGVEVRLMYDDLGSIGTTSWRYAAELNKAGIRCRSFNPALPFLNLFLNNRDHRKITVIDGKVGYTGGYNLADEYFHYTKPYGHWKDTGIRLEGRAVRNLTATFLELWNLNSRTEEDVSAYLRIDHRVAASGAVQPFGDSPLDGERSAENMYLNIINQAKHYVWFMTPYLIITDEMRRSLELAAKRGVDVRLITPGVPDKKAVWAVTRSYYGPLVAEGVRIFEYAPGFCHGKMCVSDGVIASIGTSNLDYRSLYLHFENNVVLYRCDAVNQMEADFKEMFPICREMTEEYRSMTLRIWQCILRLFAPLL